MTRFTPVPLEKLVTRDTPETLEKLVTRGTPVTLYTPLEVTRTCKISDT